MPRVSYLNTKATRISDAINRCHKISNVLKGYANAPAIAEKGLTKLRESSARDKLENPESLTLSQLIEICVTFDIPREDIISRIVW